MCLKREKMSTAMMHKQIAVYFFYCIVFVISVMGQQYSSKSLLS